MIDTLNFIGTGLIVCGVSILYLITLVYLVKLCSRCAVDGDIVEAGVCMAFLMLLTGWGISNVASVI